MFNKVMTAQYYIWYMVFWPLMLVNSRLVGDRKTWLVIFVIVWASG